MEEIEEIDPGDEEEYWKVQDYKNYSKSYESNSKLSRIWRGGVNLGKKMVVTGVVVSSASFVLPPLVVLSAIGVAFSVPAGVVIVSYACGEKLLNTLLPMPLALPYEGNGPMYSDESGKYIVYEDDVDKGYEGDEDIQLEEDLRKGMEMRIELAEENNKETVDHDQTSANEDELDKMSSKVSEIVEEWGYEEDLGEYNEDEEQPLNSEMIPDILKGIEEAENEISLIKKEEGEMPKDSLKGIVVEAQLGSENENNVEEVTEDMAFVGEEDESSVDQMRGYKSLGEYIEDEEPSDSEIIAELLEGIHEEENEISFMEKEEYEIPRAVLEAQVGREGENDSEHVMEDMAFASPRNIEDYKGNSTGIEEDELHRDVSGLIKEMSDESTEETRGENEEIERALIKDMSQVKGNTNLTILSKEVKEVENEIYLLEKESDMPRDSLLAVVIEAHVSEENDNNVEQVTLDIGESENNLEQVRGYEEDVREKMEDEVENEILAGIKWAENEISSMEKDEGGILANSLRAVVLEAQVSGENENNIEQVTEGVAFIIPTIEVEKENRCSGNDAGLAEGELRRETTGLIEKMRDEGKNDWKRNDSSKEKALEENEKSEKGFLKGVSDKLGNKDITVILEEPKPIIDDKGKIQGRKNDANLNNTSIEADESGLLYKESRTIVENWLVVNVKDDENGTATEVHQGISLVNLETSVLSNNDREMAGESGFPRSDNGTEEPDQFADSFDTMPEGDDVSLTVDYREVVIESLPVSETTETAPDQGIASSDKVKLDEEKIWEQINAMRTIVGYKNTPHFSCAEELKALYVFTGVEPPATCKGPADLADINENLHFLMSIVGVK
ncbi:midasin-like [Chenopodium quinoa]|uniref:Uncharacterized protein n=1 Tax=Chenopodium quinoa TaxID=63459 RepID=A0A803L4D2_CHEQI|nr:midasin-like [Chenopodium quinoa]